VTYLCRGQISHELWPIGVPRRESNGPCPPPISENIVISSIEKRFSKQNSVIRLKSNILAPKNFELATPLLGPRIFEAPRNSFPWRLITNSKFAKLRRGTKRNQGCSANKKVWECFKNSHLKQLKTRFKANLDKGVGTPFSRVPASLHPC